MARFQSPITDMKPLGHLLFFKSGTNSALITYKDDLESIENVAQITVNPDGNVANVFFSGSAKVKYFDQFGQQYAERDPVGGEKQLGDFTLWDTVVNYDKNDIVEGSNGKFYISLSNGNIANDPTLEPSSWSEIRFLGVWNTNVTYSIGTVVQSALGNLWKAKTSNSGNDPEVDRGDNWLRAIDESWNDPETISFTGVAREPKQIDASTNVVDVLIPALSVGDAFTYHNLITSEFKVQILNPTQTIKGSGGDILAGVNMEMKAGQSVQMIAKSTTTLSIVGALV